MGERGTVYESACSLAEVMICHALAHGVPAVREHMPAAVTQAKLPRQSLARAASELKEAGLVELAAIARDAARTAKRDPTWPSLKRMLTRSGDDYRKRRKATNKACKT